MFSENASNVEYPIDFKTKSYDQSFEAKIIKVCFQPDFKQLVLCIFSYWLLTFILYPILLYPTATEIILDTTWNSLPEFSYTDLNFR